VSLPRLLLITSNWPPPGKTVRHNAELLQAAGVSVDVFAHRGHNPFNYLAAWTTLRPRLHPGRYDVVQPQEAPEVLLTVPKRVPVVLSVGRLRFGVRFLARRADAVVVPSEEIGRRLGALGARTTLFVIPPDANEQARTARLLEVYRCVQPSQS